jgi:hypothetical protein
MSERAAKEAGEPATWDAAFREGRASGLGQAAGLPYKDAWLHAVNTTQNDRGEWVPAADRGMSGEALACSACYM